MRASFDFFTLLEEKRRCVSSENFRPVEEILIRFRENKFDDLLKTENHAELEKLNDQLEAIGHHKIHFIFIIFIKHIRGKAI